MIEMLRRQKTVWQALLLFAIVGLILRSAYNYYNDNESKLRSAKIRHHELLEERNSLTRKVDDALAEKSNLELTLKTKIKEFADQKKAWNDERITFMNDANKAKERYDALNTEFKNLEANHKDSQVDCSNHKATLDRLKKDHSRMNIEHSRNYRDLKEKNLKTIIALQNEVEKYQKQAQTMQMQIDTLQQSLTKYQNVAAKTAKNSNIISKSAGFDMQGLTGHKDISYSRIRRRKRKIKSLGNHQVPKKYGFEKNLEEKESLPSWDESSKKSNNFDKPVNTYEKIFSNINKDLAANVDHEANSKKLAGRYDVIDNNEREIEDTGKSNEDIVNKDVVENEDNVPNEKNFIEPHAVINHNAIENQDTINNNEDVINNVNKNNENHPLQLNEEKKDQEIVNVMKENMEPEGINDENDKNVDNIEVVDHDNQEENNFNVDNKDQEDVDFGPKDEVHLKRDKRNADWEDEERGENENNIVEENHKDEIMELPQDAVKEEAEDEDEFLNE